MAGLINLVLILIIVAVLAALAWWFTMVLPKEGFEDYSLAQADPTCVYREDACSSANRVVLYMAKWCGHCKAFKPEFDKAAAQAKRAGLDACFVTVDSDDQPKGSSCLNYKGVSGFPTVLLEKSGTSPPFLSFNGSRDAASLLKWVADGI